MGRAGKAPGRERGEDREGRGKEDSALVVDADILAPTKATELKLA